MLRDDGTKLSKAGKDTGLREMRAAGLSAGDVIGIAAHASGLVPKPMTVNATDLASLVSEKAPPARWLGGAERL